MHQVAANLFLAHWTDPSAAAAEQTDEAERRSLGIYLLLGCETSGLPPFVTDEESCTSLEIPSLSASINVGCAFSVVLTCLILAQKT